MKFYAFEYTDGRNTTTGDGNDLHIAGTLWSFPTKTARNAYVESAEYNHRKGRYDVRDAVLVRALPFGWKVSDAEPYETE